MGARDPRIARSLLALETSPKFANAPYTVGLVWPNDYATAMSSLGYLWVYDALNVDDLVACERYVASGPCWGPGEVAGSLERNTPLDACDLIAVSISYELDLVNLVHILDDAGIPAARDERCDDHPLVLIGGPLCRSNPLPLQAIGDLVVHGDGEDAIAGLLATLRQGRYRRQELFDALAVLPGVLTGDAPGNSPFCMCHNQPDPKLPIVAPVRTPEASLGDLTLVEVSRGCPRSCTFCLGRRDRSPLRLAPTDAVVGAARGETPGLGLIGAALSYFPGLKEVLQVLAAQDKKAGISSLRAEKVDRELLELLLRTGGEVLTVAADGASQRLRDALHKSVSEAAIIHAAELAREVGLNAFKLYTLIGVPGETEEDLDEFVDLVNHLRTLLPVMVSVSIFVPKGGTPLADAPWISPKEGTRRMRYLLRESSGGVRYNQLSPKEAFLQAVVSTATAEDGQALIAAARAGGGFSEFRRNLPERFGKGPR